MGRSRAPRGFRQLPNLERRLPRHFADQANLYRFLASQGEPYLRLADPQSIALVLKEVAVSGIKDEELSAVSDRVAAALSGTVSAADVKFTILSLAYSNVMSSWPPEVAVEERRYTLSAAGVKPDNLRAALLATVREKLETRLGAVDDDVLEGSWRAATDGRRATVVATTTDPPGAADVPPETVRRGLVSTWVDIP